MTDMGGIVAAEARLVAPGLSGVVAVEGRHGAWAGSDRWAARQVPAVVGGSTGTCGGVRRVHVPATESSSGSTSAGDVRPAAGDPLGRKPRGRGGTSTGGARRGSGGESRARSASTNA